MDLHVWRRMLRNLAFLLAYVEELEDSLGLNEIV